MTSPVSGDSLDQMKVYSFVYASLLLSSSVVLAAVFFPQSTCAYAPHIPIYIYGNEDFTIENGVTSGDGTSSNPYVIENLTIPVESGQGISIAGTDAHFIVRNVDVIGLGVDTTWGIGLSDVSNGSIVNCSLPNHYSGITADNSWDVAVSLNTLSDFNQSGIAMMQCGRWQISGNTIESAAESSRGISVSYDTTHVTISGNTITYIRNDNELGFGIGAWIANNLTVMGNVISDCDVGISLPLTNDSLVTQNNLIDNSMQGFSSYTYTTCWNSSYPEGGNYWSDYDGYDEYSGPNQDVPGSDGIGDTPYAVNLYIEDAYPIMEPIGGIVSNTAPVAVLSVNPSGGGTLDVFTFDASESHDLESDSSILEVRWDWDDDGTWDVDWSTDKVEEHRFQVPGSYTTRIEVKDQTGLTDQATMDVEVMDDVPPVTHATVDGEVGENDWYVSEVEITLSFTDAWSEVASTEYCLDGGAWTEYAEPFKISAQGNHILQFWSEDEKGNSETIQKVDIAIDSQAPLLWIHQEQGIVFASSSPSIAWSCQDAVSGICRVELSVDGAEFEDLENLDSWVSSSDETTTYVNLTNLEEGDHTLIVRVYDFAGLKSETMLNFRVDIESRILGMSPVSLLIVISVLAAAAIATTMVIVKRRGSSGKPPE